jgi:peptide/nickel transport system permease protein/oligopeptide transport system permease protein
MTELTTSTTASAPLAKPEGVRQRSPLYFAWRRFTANKAAVGAGIILLIIILMAIFAPVITTTGPNDQDFLTNALNFPSAAHWFGVDNLGRDFFTRIVYGARVSLGIGFSAAVFSLIVGLPLGALAGYLGGRFDWVVMRIIELFSVVPPLLAALLLATVTRGGVWAIILIAGIFGWKDVCLLVRAQVKSFREKEFIMAAQALGASPWHIVWRHLIPNSVSPIIVGFVLAIPLAMMLEASLSFLGIGVQPPTPSWGQMINVGMNFMFYYWHMAVFPTAALAVTILAASLLGDGLRDALDPTLKGR